MMGERHGNLMVLRPLLIHTPPLSEPVMYQLKHTMHGLKFNH